jgi:SAM-dependent methyltransferase
VRVREMMLGLRDEFDYFECSNCQALSLVTPPGDPARYYPDDYYSFAALLPPPASRRAPWREWMYRRRNVAQLIRRPLFWSLVARLQPRPAIANLRQLFRHANLRGPEARILDVGCGSGRLLHRLASIGFNNLWGVDPYISEACERSGAVRILRGDLAAAPPGSFDLIMLHHSLEHIEDQRGTFCSIRRLLAPGGTCLIRIPLAASDPWQRYGADWVDLDAPRHFVLHTPKSIQLLAGQSGLSVIATEFDSDAFTYWASELYRRGLPLCEQSKSAHRDPCVFFTGAELREFESWARQANETGTSGRGVFYLRASTGGRS